VNQSEQICIFVSLYLCFFFFFFFFFSLLLHSLLMSSLVGFVFNTVVDSVTRLRRTLWRNRRRVAVLAVLGGVAVLGWRALWRRLDAMHRDQVRRLESQSVQNARRRAYFNDAQATADAYARAALKLLQARLDTLIALPSPLELRGAGGSKERKVELWTAFKVGSFARLLAAVYALCMSLLLVRVQLNLVSRYVHLRTLQRAAADAAAAAAAAASGAGAVGGGGGAGVADGDVVDDDESIARGSTDRRVLLEVAALLDDATQTEFFTRGKYLEQTGIAVIVEALQPAAAAAVESRALDEPIDAAGLLRIVDNVRAALGPRGEQRLLLRAVLSPDSETTVSASGKLDVIGLLVNETISVLESDACRIVLDKCVSDAVMLALAGIAGDAGTPLVRLVVHIGRAADKLLLDDAALRMLGENAALRALSFATFTDGLGNNVD
jgi:hypothetical protein